MEEHQSVCFLMATQNISLSRACDKTKKTSLSISLPSSKLIIFLILFASIVNFANFSWHVSGDQPLMIWFFYFIVK